MGASPQTPGVLRIEPMGWRLVDRAASKPPHDPEARGPFGAIRRSGCSPAEPYPADDPARFSVRLTPPNANREATSRPPGLRPGSNPSRWLLPGVKTPPNKQETVTDVVGQFVTHVPVRTIYTPQRSSTLGTFVAMSGTPTVTSIDAQWERVSVEEPASPATVPSAFARVRVSLP
jgi:hypothetical protein